jgi:uncharacterized protein YkwD
VRREQIVPWVVLVALVVGFQLAPRLTAAAVQGSEPTGRESARIGWDDGATAAAISHDIHERLNDERAARGLPPLRWHAGLAQRARQWSRHMIAEGDYRHSPASFQAHEDFVGTGENILMLYVGSADAHVGWMESDGHRENILRPEFTAVGVGAVCRHDGRLWATQIFGVAPGHAPRTPAANTGVSPIVRQDPGIDCPDLPFWRR